jgi:hypothetical protein
VYVIRTRLKNDGYTKTRKNEKLSCYGVNARKEHYGAAHDLSVNTDIKRPAKAGQSKQGWRLLDVLNLFAHLFYQHFQLNS